MHIEFDPRLSEDVVFLAMRGREEGGDQAMYGDYRRRLDALYEFSGDAHDREVAFRELFSEFFRTLGYERLLRDVLGEYPLLGRRLDRVSFFTAASRKQEGGDLFVRNDRAAGQADRRTALVRLCAQTFLETERLIHFLRRELYHVADMVDPRFGYRRDLQISEETLARQNLIRDRYRVLWSVFIDARLLRDDRSSPAELDGRQRLLEKAFQGLGDEEVEGVFRTVCTVENLTHTDLLTMATTGVVSTAPGQFETAQSANG